jgi:protein-tyrosine phosphatase
MSRRDDSSFGEISDLNGHLYLSAAHVLKPESIKRKNINFIVNATVEEPNMYLKNGDYLKIRINDHPYARLDAYFDIVADKVKSNKDKGGKSLIHCVAGVSRSASLCIAYFMKYENMSLKQAYNHIKAVRPIIRPNHGFWQQLIDYELRLFGSNTVQMAESRWGPEEPVPDIYVDELKERVINRPTAYHVGRAYTGRSQSTYVAKPLSSSTGGKKYRSSYTPSMTSSLTSLTTGSGSNQFRSKLKSDMINSLYDSPSYTNAKQPLWSATNGAYNSSYRTPLRSL